MDVAREARRFTPVPRLAIRRQIRAADVCSTSSPPRSSLRVARLMMRRLPAALTEGHTWSVSLGRLEPSELLPHPSGAVTPDVALRSALSSPLRCSPLLLSAPPGGSRRRRAVRRYVRALQRCMRGADGWIREFTCQRKTKSILLKNGRITNQPTNQLTN